jgi:hypothetical protein
MLFLKNRQRIFIGNFLFAINRGPAHNLTIKITGRLSDLMNAS